jgi:hypothetical protein
MKSGMSRMLTDPERVLGKLDCPEKAGRWNSTVVVVDLCARPGREQVNSHLRECPLASFAIFRNVFSLHDPDVCLEVILRPVISGGSADMVRQHGNALKIGDRAGLHVQAL